MRVVRYVFLLLAILFLVGCTTESFQYPDIKDDFCGVHINYQFCKCAFHNDFCDSVGMSKSEANAHVNAEYDKWVAQQLGAWLEACAASGGIPGEDDCTHCDEGYVADGDECVPVGEAQQLGSTTAFKADGPLTDDCEIIQSEFDRDWKKYSDIDEVIPFNERSYEAKQALTVYDEMIENMIEAFALERDIEIENQMQAELEEYRTALVNNIKTNLLKAFWRLSWVTYTTTNSGTGLGKSYSTVLTSGSAVESIGAGLKVVQGTIPKDSQLAIDTSTTEGKAAKVGANTAIKAVQTLGDPTQVASELFKSASNAALPSADISQEEIDILHEQHIEQGLLDQVLQNSRDENAKREARLAELEIEITKQQKEIDGWEAKEKERVKNSLESSCLTLKEQHEGE